MVPTLVIGNYNYSSWSLRAWLYMRESNIEFEVLRIPLFTASWRREIGRYSPTKRVPVLLDGDVTVWDTVAIFEYLREQVPGAVGWPAERVARAEARSISAEMHAGFMAVRDELPQNIRTRRPLALASLSDAAQGQVERISDLWRSCRQRYGNDGPWLYGEFSIADVMYAPVALRFITYDIPAPGRAAEFVDAVSTLPSIAEWRAAAAAEAEHLDFVDNLLPAADAPLTLG